MAKNGKNSKNGKNGKTALAKLSDVVNNYAIVTTDYKQQAEIVRHNMGKGGVDIFDLTRIKMPQGEATEWTIPQLIGPSKSAAEFDGVILFQQKVRAMWDDEETLGLPPNCTTDNAYGKRGGSGVGDPGGDCNQCPFSEFGSSEKGEGCKCKLIWRLFILRPEDKFPILLAAPPGSLGNLGKYFAGLSFKAVPYHLVVNKFKIEKVTNKANNQPYSKLIVEPTALLEGADLEFFDQVHKEYSGDLGKVEVSADDYSSEENS